MPTLEEEKKAFDEQLPELLKTHAGEFVLFKDKKPVGFFRERSAAYEAGLGEFGLDSVFLLVQVAEPDPNPVSIAWEAGVMFG